MKVIKIAYHNAGSEEKYVFNLYIMKLQKQKNMVSGKKVIVKREHNAIFETELELFILLKSWYRLCLVFMTCKLKHLIFNMFKYKQQQFGNQKE